MKILAVLIFFFGLPSWAGQWVSVEANHANFLYSEGERASFIFRKMVKPVSPDYSVETRVSVGGGAEEIIDYHENSGAFTTEPLVDGETDIFVTTKVLGPSGFERTVESESFRLFIHSNGVSL